MSLRNYRSTITATFLSELMWESIWIPPSWPCLPFFPALIYISRAGTRILCRSCQSSFASHLWSPITRCLSFLWWSSQNLQEGGSRRVGSHRTSLVKFVIVQHVGSCIYATIKLFWTNWKTVSDLQKTWPIRIRYYSRCDNDKYKGYRLRFKFTKDTPYLTVTGKMWRVFCEYFVENNHVIKGFDCDW